MKDCLLAQSDNHQSGIFRYLYNLDNIWVIQRKESHTSGENNEDDEKEDSIRSFADRACRK